MERQGTQFTEVLPVLDAGIFADKIGRALSEVALGVVTTGKKGKVTITLDLAQVANGHQVSVRHGIKYTKPTDNGNSSEENTTETPLYVGFGGRLTFEQPDQQKLFKEPSQV